MNWSGGKDSSLALFDILQQKTDDVSALLTTVNSANNRISMHGVRTSLLELQAESIGLPLKKIMLPEMPSMSVYDEAMRNTMNEMKTEGITHSIFGDIFLEDLKSYRDTKLNEVGLQGIYPLWKQDSRKLVERSIALGFKSGVVSVIEKVLDNSFCGRLIDHDLLNDLPPNVDPCGENGEYHSFVFDGPLFKKPISFSKGEIVYRNYSKNEDDSDVYHTNSTHPDSGFWYLDLELR